jgi:hypothetical protein
VPVARYPSACTFEIDESNGKSGKVPTETGAIFDVQPIWL